MSGSYAIVIYSLQTKIWEYMWRQISLILIAIVSKYDCFAGADDTNFAMVWPRVLTLLLLPDFPIPDLAFLLFLSSHLVAQSFYLRSR